MNIELKPGKHTNDDGTTTKVIITSIFKGGRREVDLGNGPFPVKTSE